MQLPTVHVCSVYVHVWQGLVLPAARLDILLLAACCCLLQVPTYVDRPVPVEVQREQPRVRKAQQHPSHLGTDWEVPCFRSLQPVCMPAQQHLLVAPVC